MKQYEYNITSQSGEDGVVEEILKRLGIKKGVCVEIGAWDGLHLSNTASLWNNKGWEAHLYEKDEEKYEELCENTLGYEVFPYREFKIGDQLPRENVDVLSIDVDGDDYHIWAAIKESPKVVIIEYNPTIPFWTKIVQKPGESFGASAMALIRLAQNKGYTLIHSTQTNLIFTLSESFSYFTAEFTKFFYNEQDQPHLSYLISGYDGKRFLIDNCPYHDNQTDRWPEVISDVPLTKVEINKVE